MADQSSDVSSVTEHGGGGGGPGLRTHGTAQFPTGSPGVNQGMTRVSGQHTVRAENAGREYGARSGFKEATVEIARSYQHMYLLITSRLSAEVHPRSSADVVARYRALMSAGRTRGDIDRFRRLASRARAARWTFSVGVLVACVGAVFVAAVTPSIWRLKNGPEIFGFLVYGIFILSYLGLSMIVITRHPVPKITVLLNSALTWSHGLANSSVAIRVTAKSLRQAALIADLRLARSLHAGAPLGREARAAAALANRMRALAEMAVSADLGIRARLPGEIAAFSQYWTDRSAWLTYPDKGDEKRVVALRVGYVIRLVCAGLAVVTAVALPLVPAFHGWGGPLSVALALISVVLVGGSEGLANAVRARGGEKSDNRA